MATEPGPPEQELAVEIEAAIKEAATRPVMTPDEFRTWLHEVTVEEDKA